MSYILLTPKNSTGKRLTCGLSSVMKYHLARKNLLRGFGKETLAVGNVLSFGKGTVCAFEEKFSGMRGDVTRYKEGTS
jgi:hypothetical protein